MSRKSVNTLYSPELTDVPAPRLATITPPLAPRRRTSAPASKQDPESIEDKVAAVFASDVANHQMTILKDDGLYRHVRFANPDSPSVCWFDLITWPGRLTITGDCSTFVFACCDDLFSFFRGNRINPGYWAQKQKSENKTQNYSMDLFEKMVKERFVEAVRDGDAPRGLGLAIRRDILDSWEYDLEHEGSAREALRNFEFEGFRLRDRDTWEWDFNDWDWHYLRCCYAIQWGIAQYDAATIPAADAVAG